MFGYVKVYQPECKFREYEYYRGVYCGLCRILGRYGPLAKATLSYDFVFLALIRMAATGEKPVFQAKRCGIHLLKKHPEASAKALDYCAGASLLLSYYKVKDDLADERGFKKAAAFCMLPWARRWRGRALRGLEELDAKIKEHLDTLNKTEKENCSSADAPGAIFGELLGEIACFGLDGAAYKLCKSLGKCIGHWIYLIDAIDDYEQDIKKGRFNALASLIQGKRPEGETAESLKVSLIAQLQSGEKILDLFSFPDAESEALVRNILYLGLPEVAEKILCRK